MNRFAFLRVQTKVSLGDRPYSVHVMTYAEFGERIHPPHQTFTNDVGLIFCDEIHSLPKYFSYDKSYRLIMPLNWVLRKHEDVQIFYFTATKESIEEFENENPGYFNCVKVFDYLEHPEIRQYIANSTYYITHLSQLRPHLRAKLKSFNYKGYKALAFTKLITEQDKIKEIAEEEGFKPIVLWSINNENKMNEEQLRVREYILNTGLIPEPYNLLIINGAMQEGWNLYDDKVTLAILDTTDITEQIQALGRIRKDVDFLIKKTNDESKKVFELIVPEKHLNKSLTPAEKRDLCDDLYVLDDQGRVKGWPTVRTLIENSNYLIEDKTEIIDGKRVRVSIITVPYSKPH